jgi:hypothetical protein
MPHGQPNGDGHEAMARIALRRWRSLSRRHKNRPGLSEREVVEDPAKGLRDAYEPDRRLVGPLMEDYRHVAGRACPRPGRRDTLRSMMRDRLSERQLMRVVADQIRYATRLGYLLL